MAATLERPDSQAIVEALLDHGGDAEPCIVLTDLLDERAPSYRGLDRNAADRLRAHVLSRFADIGLPALALPYVREELEAGDSVVCMAAAARALAGTDQQPAWAPAALMSSVERVLYANDSVSFTANASAHPADTTILAELFLALGRLGASGRDALPRLQELAAMAPRPFDGITANALEQALATMEVSGSKPCCGAVPSILPSAIRPTPRQLCADVLRALRMEDAEGQQASLAEFLDGELNVVAFFYTRCMNPAKCSATIEKLVALQSRLSYQAGSVRLAAISYDPLYDTPSRLATYGSNRGIGSECPVHLLRCLDGIEPLMEHFDLGVGFGETTVNRHRSEVFLLDAHSRVITGVLRRQFEIDEALSLIQHRLAGTPVGEPSL